ncbi:MAG: amidohydrolase family protein, partial [Mucilaginibacter sp.]
MKKLYIAFLLLFSASAFAQKTYIQCGKLIDGISNQAQTQMTIVVDGGLIADIQKGYTSGGTSDNIVDLKNMTVMPGLIDCHVHLEEQGSKTSIMEGFIKTDADVAYQAAIYAKRTLMAGFTTVRDLGGSGVNTS